MKNNQVAAFLNQSIATSLETQNLRFREYWEPRVIAALTPAAGQCMERIREALAWQRRLAWPRRNPAAPRLALGASCARIVAERVADAATLLQEMVETESALAGEALSRPASRSRPWSPCPCSRRRPRPRPSSHSQTYLSAPVRRPGRFFVVLNL